MGNKKKTQFAITDPLLIDCLVKYVACFPEEEREGRFFRYLRMDKVTGKLVGTKNVIGINSIGKVPMHIAGYVGKKDPSKFTSHANRRIGATLLAEGTPHLSGILSFVPCLLSNFIRASSF